MGAIHTTSKVLTGIGLMSGTSMDGLDIACVSFANGNSLEWKLLATHFIPYPSAIYDLVVRAHQLGIEQYYHSHIQLGQWFGEAVKKFVDEQNINVDFICSHGQTIVHRPLQQFTIQMGHGAYISAASGITTITDLRSMDMAFGGQGAPMVPIGERALFTDNRLFLNIGGIANISYHNENAVIGFDICSANNVLNYLSKKLQMQFDLNGEVAKSGSLLTDLLDDLNGLQYYQRLYPKSLDKEQNLHSILQFIEKHNNRPIKDLLRTYTEHIAFQIGKAVHQLNINEEEKVFVTGGGGHNAYLIERLNANINAKMHLPNKEIIDYKEAIVMAYFGFLRMCKRENFIHSVTGSSTDSIGGAVYYGNKD